MKTHRIAIVLTIVNFLLITPTLFRVNLAAPPDTAQVLRVRSLELVDDHGRVRAELKVFPAQPEFKMPDGTTGYPESVLLRLIDSKNGPNVKLSATEDGAALVIGGESGYVQILSRGRNPPLIKIANKDGQERTFKSEGP